MFSLNDSAQVTHPIYNVAIRSRCIVDAWHFANVKWLFNISLWWSLREQKVTLSESNRLTHHLVFPTMRNYLDDNFQNWIGWCGHARWAVGLPDLKEAYWLLLHSNAIGLWLFSEEIQTTDTHARTGRNTLIPHIAVLFHCTAMNYAHWYWGT